jgi:hypothetical protein
MKIKMKICDGSEVEISSGQNITANIEGEDVSAKILTILDMDSIVVEYSGGWLVCKDTFNTSWPMMKKFENKRAWVITPRDIVHIKHTKVEPTKSGGLRYL